MDAAEAVDYAIFAIRTFQEPEASSDEDVAKLDEHGDEIADVLAGLREELRHPPKVYTIVVEHPQEDPDYVTFAPENLDVETHYLTTYYISKWNTEGIGEAVENIDGWVHEAIHHEDQRVRDWFQDFVNRQVSVEKFRIDWELGRVVEYAAEEYDMETRRHVTRWHPTDEGGD